jgi:hypothetical protein
VKDEEAKAEPGDPLASALSETSIAGLPIEPKNKLIS